MRYFYSYYCCYFVYNNNNRTNNIMSCYTHANEVNVPKMVLGTILHSDNCHRPAQVNLVVGDFVHFLQLESTIEDNMYARNIIILYYYAYIRIFIALDATGSF